MKSRGLGVLYMDRKRVEIDFSAELRFMRSSPFFRAVRISKVSFPGAVCLSGGRNKGTLKA